MRPILYLDVDDTILRFPPYEGREWWLANPRGGPADGVREFLAWALAVTEVRWLTMWCAGGEMHPDSLARLCDALRIGRDDPLRAQLAGVRNPIPFRMQTKTDAIDWDAHAAGRDWVWVEDEILDREDAVLRGRGVRDRFIQCNTSLRAERLLRVHARLVKRWGAAPCAERAA